MILVQFLLLCSGCDRQGASWEEKLGESNLEVGSTVSTAKPSMDAIIPLMAEAPLLEWEDPEAEHLADMLQDACSGMMVRLSNGQNLGSGIIYSTEEEFLVIVTAGHVLADAVEGVKIVFVDGWETASREVSVSELADLAVVRIPLMEIPRERLEKYLLANVDKSSYEGLQAGDGCIVMGSRSGVAEDAYEGIILDSWIYMEDYDQYMIWVSAPGKPGMSGGGLFDRWGHLLGVLSGCSEDGEWAVVPLAMLLAEL